MDSETTAFILSTTALALYSASYFFNNKRNYLILQIIGNVFLALSYLMINAYFTMISVGIGIGRGVICYIYEKRNKEVPIYMIAGLCFATISSYIIVNHIILSGTTSPWDVLYLIASCMYSITFAIRNIKLMRYLVTIPHTCAIAYNLLVKAPITSALSYGIELAVTVVAIIKFQIQENREKKKH